MKGGGSIECSTVNESKQIAINHHSDKGLMLKISALKLFMVANVHYELS